MPRWSGWYWTTSSSNTHRIRPSLYDTFPAVAGEARRIVKRSTLEFHHTPKHASTLAEHGGD